MNVHRSTTRAFEAGMTFLLVIQEQEGLTKSIASLRLGDDNLVAGKLLSYIIAVIRADIYFILCVFPFLMNRRSIWQLEVCCTRTPPVEV